MYILKIDWKIFYENFTFDNILDILPNFLQKLCNYLIEHLCPIFSTIFLKLIYKISFFHPNIIKKKSQNCVNEVI